MIRILLIRHGNTALLGRVLYGRMPDIHLDARGVDQAESLAQELKPRYKLSGLWSSPLERALETARPIADSQHLSILIDDGLNEIDFGSWMGKAFSELATSDQWIRYNQLRATTSPPGGESMMEVQARSWNTLRQISSRYSDSKDVTVAVITHGDVIRALLILLLGMSLDHIQRLEVAPASVSEVLLDGGEPRIRSINQTYGRE